MRAGQGRVRIREGGFSLVELIIGVTLIFIVSGIAFQAYRGYLDTSRDSALRHKAEELRLFQGNYRVDNGTYLAGDYVPGGVNDFVAAGYRPQNDRSGISLEVEAGACGTIADCYKVTAENAEGRRYIWDNGAESWEN